MTLPPIRKRLTSIKVGAIRKLVNTVPKVAEFKNSVALLKRQLSNYEKAESDPDAEFQRENLRQMIVESVARIAVKMAARQGE